MLIVEKSGDGGRVKNERENCSICSFVTFALCRTDKRNYTVRPEWYIPLHFHTRHTFSLPHLLSHLGSSRPSLFLFSSSILPHFPHRMYKQPIFVYNSIVVPRMPFPCFFYFVTTQIWLILQFLYFKRKCIEPNV